MQILKYKQNRFFLLKFLRKKKKKYIIWKEFFTKIFNRKNYKNGKQRFKTGFFTRNKISQQSKLTNKLFQRLQGK